MDDSSVLFVNALMKRELIRMACHQGDQKSFPAWTVEGVPSDDDSASFIRFLDEVELGEKQESSVCSLC